MKTYDYHACIIQRCSSDTGYLVKVIVCSYAWNASGIGKELNQHFLVHRLGNVDRALRVIIAFTPG
jgi:hypothetical protein